MSWSRLRVSRHRTTVRKPNRSAGRRHNSDRRPFASKHTGAIGFTGQRKNDRKRGIGPERGLALLQRPDADDREHVADEPLLCLAPGTMIGCVLRPARPRADSATGRARIQPQAQRRRGPSAARSHDRRRGRDGCGSPTRRHRPVDRFASTAEWPTRPQRAGRTSTA